MEEEAGRTTDTLENDEEVKHLIRAWRVGDNIHFERVDSTMIYNAETLWDWERSLQRVHDACLRLFPREAFFWMAEIQDLTDGWYYESEEGGHAASAAACLWMYHKLRKGVDHEFAMLRFPLPQRMESVLRHRECPTMRAILISELESERP